MRFLELRERSMAELAGQPGGIQFVDPTGAPAPDALASAELQWRPAPDRSGFKSMQGVICLSVVLLVFLSTSWVCAGTLPQDALKFSAPITVRSENIHGKMTGWRLSPRSPLLINTFRVAEGTIEDGAFSIVDRFDVLSIQKTGVLEKRRSIVLSEASHLRWCDDGSILAHHASDDDLSDRWRLISPGGTRSTGLVTGPSGLLGDGVVSGSGLSYFEAVQRLDERAYRFGAAVDTPIKARLVRLNFARGKVETLVTLPAESYPSNVLLEKLRQRLWWYDGARLSSFDLKRKRIGQRATPSRYRSIAISPDSRWLAAWFSESELTGPVTVMFWDLAADRRMGTVVIQGASTSRQGAWSPDSKQFAISTTRRLGAKSLPSEVIEILDVGRQDIVQRLPVPVQGTLSLEDMRWYANPNRIMAVSYRGGVWSWLRVRTGR